MARARAPRALAAIAAADIATATHSAAAHATDDHTGATVKYHRHTAAIGNQALKCQKENSPNLPKRAEPEVRS